ncbi:MAG: sulfotransferase family protein [Verrucomicrobiota bacterium]
MTRRICVWSGPRNVSTALMYSFAQRRDTTVVDEPLYAAYLATAGRREDHPAWEDVLASQPTDPADAIRTGMLHEPGTEVLFIKNMAQHWRTFNVNLLEHFTNILLFRHPVLVARSFDKIVESPTPEDLGYPQQLEILNALRARDLPVHTLDSTAVRNDPETTLTSLCEKLGLPFDATMLHWPPGPKPADGVGAPHWYGNVHQSTGFVPDAATIPDPGHLPDHLQGTVEECFPMWDQLAENVIF